MLPAERGAVTVTRDDAAPIEDELSVTLMQYTVVAVGDAVYALDVAPLITFVHAELEYHW